MADRFRVFKEMFDVDEKGLFAFVTDWQSNSNPLLLYSQIIPSGFFILIMQFLAIIKNSYSSLG